MALPISVQCVQGSAAGRVFRSDLLIKVSPFRPIALKLMKLAGDPDQPMSSIVDLLRADPVLVAEILRCSKSALLGRRFEIGDIRQAVAWLGLERINALIVTAAMRSMVTLSGRDRAHGVWRHSVATALIAERLAQSAGLSKDKCYVAGLVHDVGRFALLRVLPNYFHAIAIPSVDGRPLVELEREMFGLDHCEAGRWLLSQWGCPIELQNVAAMHESPPAPPARDRALICLVKLASELADLMGMSGPGAAPVELSAVVRGLSGNLRRELMTRYDEILQAVAVGLNEIEMSLV